MEKIGPVPADPAQPAEPTDAADARDALAGIEDAQRSLRDTPWPLWLYLANAVLLGALALTPLLREDGRSPALLAVAGVVIATNLVAGYRMGIPWVLPHSRGFLAAVATAIACVVAALVVALFVEPIWPVVVLAIAATVTYLIGAVMHRRSTGAPR